MTNHRIASAAACALIVASSAVVGSPTEQDAVGSINRYCAASWRRAHIPHQDWNDCTQQVFLELLDRVSRDRFGEAVHKAKSCERRELNRAIWCTVQRWRRTQRCRQLGDEDVPDVRQARAQAAIRTREEIDEASAKLNDRQQKVLRGLLDGGSIAEIAGAQGVPASRISDDKYRAVRKLRQYFGVSATNLDNGSRRPRNPAKRNGDGSHA